MAADWNWVAAATLVQTGAAIVQGVVAVAMMRGLRHAEVQARAAQEAVRETKVASHRELRAYVDLAWCECSPRKHGEAWKIDIRVKNYGATPARHVRATTDFYIADMEMMRDRPIPPIDRKGSDNSLSREEEMQFPLSIPWPVWAPCDPYLRNGDAFFGLAGKIVYQDVFGEDQSSEFRRYLDPEVHPTKLVAVYGGNRAT